MALRLHVSLFTPAFRQLPCRWLSEKREETSSPDTQRNVLSLSSCSPLLGHVLSPHPRTGHTRWCVRVGPLPLAHGGVSKGWNSWLLLLQGNEPGGASGKELTCQCRKHKRHGFSPWVWNIPWRRAWQPTPVFLPGAPHRQRSLVGYCSWDHKGSNTTEAI